MNTVYLEPSDKAKRQNWMTHYKTYFEECPVDMSFIIKECNDIQLGTMRSYVSRYGKAHGKRFKAVKHEDCFEICRKK